MENTVSSWKKGEGYNDIKGFCKTSTIEVIKKNDYVLSPGRYVGFVDSDKDEVSFDIKYEQLKKELNILDDQGKLLSKQILKSLDKIKIT